ncbi:hypothetical protein, conserved [Plasmodium gonderi]|uniref:Uncharacterized protein n=1 Tax=Plasmodium gonderi TaxID=77519 RepID=A0A1Y1JIK7_PLAGO|nr:hypothetical protein, conserved [Plasmodium gonderi]GAW79914.1 hypothetical protein, conserved [Plasmodium gonderi]
MSLNFSDDEDVYAQGDDVNLEGDDINGRLDDDHIGDAEDGYIGLGADNVTGDERNEEEEKKKRKKSITFQLKNLFNDVALNKITNHIVKKRKSEHRNSCNSTWDSHRNDDQASNDIPGDDDILSEEEDELQKYVREEKNKIKQILPENDELWDIYMYLNLKKKRRKIDYNEKHYSAAIRKILEYVTNEYKNIISEKLFLNKTLKKYLILPDQSEFFQKSKIENVEKNTSIPIIRRRNSLKQIKKKLVELYNKGNCCSYTKDEELTHLYADDRDGEFFSDHPSSSGHYNRRGNSNENLNRNETNNFDQIRKDNNFIIEKEKLNLELTKLTDKYTRMVNKIRQHRRKSLKTNFNLFMNLINEVTSKLYFSVHSVLLMGDNQTDLTDVYKTIRRKYNIHDVLGKIQNLSQKKEFYEHYRAYLLYKYKSTYPVCDKVFKTHEMVNNVNIFNFKKFYSTEFGTEKFFVIREEEEKEEEEESVQHDDANAKGKVGQEKSDDFFSKDVYDVYDSNDFFHVNVRSDEVPAGTHVEKTARDPSNVQVSNACTNVPVDVISNISSGITGGNPVHTEPSVNGNVVEETPLERAKRIAREKKQKLMESRIKIV